MIPYGGSLYKKLGGPKPASGIPRAFLELVDDPNTPGAVITAEGKVAVPKIDKYLPILLGSFSSLILHPFVLLQLSYSVSIFVFTSFRIAGSILSSNLHFLKYIYQFVIFLLLVNSEVFDAHTAIFKTF